MLKLRANRHLIILISLTLLLGSVMAAQALPLHSVGLLSFEATALADAVQLDWETATEVNTAGFIIKRSINGGDFISLPDIGVPGFIDADGNPAGFVVSAGGPAEGATYQEMDNDVELGNSYTYKLIEVTNSNNEVELDTQTVLLGAGPTHTPTVQALATNTPTPIATATETSAPASPVSSIVTSTATATQSAAEEPTSQPPAAAATAPGLPPTALPTLASTPQPEPVIESSEATLASIGVTSSNTVLAQAQATATVVLLSVVQPITSEDNSYPGLQFQVEPTQELNTPTPILLEAATPYPAATGDAGEETVPTGVPVIGSQNSDQSGNSPANQSTSRDQRLGKIYLWGGFLLSLLIFIMTVVATILLFTRKRAQ